MVSAKTLFLAFLATTAIATPVLVLEERGDDALRAIDAVAAGDAVRKTTSFREFKREAAIACPGANADFHSKVTCKYKDEAGKQNSVTFSTSSAKTLAKKAPAGTVATKSGYPHEFQNFDNGIKWPNSQCNSAKVKTLEFPIFTDKKKQNTLYDYTKPKDNNKPGPCRIVYAQTGGAFCGIMCHESMVQNDDNRGFKLCQ